MQNTKDLGTQALCDLAHNTMLSGRWSEARAYLDDLARREDIKGITPLYDVDTYVQLSPDGIPEGYRGIIEDRINQVNGNLRFS